MSELCRGNPKVAREAGVYLRDFGRLTVSSVTIFERLRGYRLAIRAGKPFERQLQAFEALASTCVVLPFDQEAAAVAARIWAGLARSQRQHLSDILIASIAISRHLSLVTRNKRDFERISSSVKIPLRLIDWTK